MDLSDALIKRGSIFHSCEFEHIDHCKFFIIIGENKDNYAGYFFINSNINRNISKKPEYFNMQAPIKKSNYSFLNYNSYIDCHAISLIPKDKLSQQIKNERTTFIGFLLEDDIELLLENLRNSDLYSENEKNSFFR